FLREEAAQRRDGTNVEADDVVDAFLVGFDDVVVNEYARIVYQHLGPDAGFPACREERLRRSGQSEVGGMSPYADAAFAFERSAACVEMPGVFPCGEYVVAPHCEPACDGETDSRTGPRHDGPSAAVPCLFRCHVHSHNRRAARSHDLDKGTKKAGADVRETCFFGVCRAYFVWYTDESECCGFGRCIAKIRLFANKRKVPS